MIQQVPLGLVTPHFPFIGLSFGAVPPTGTEMEARTFGPRLRNRHKPTALSTLAAQGRELILTLVSPPSEYCITIQVSESIFPRIIHERLRCNRLPAPVRLTARVLLRQASTQSDTILLRTGPFAHPPFRQTLCGKVLTQRPAMNMAGQAYPSTSEDSGLLLTHQHPIGMVIIVQ